MDAYTPSSVDLVGVLATVVLAMGIAGFLLQDLSPGRVPSLAAWTIFLAGVVTVERITSGQPAGFRMVALMGAAMVTMKAVVGTRTRMSGQAALSFPRWLMFALLWAGMRPRVFARREPALREGAGALLWKGCVRMAVGASLIVIAKVTNGSGYLSVAILLVGLSLVVHFGVLNVVAGMWRYVGFRCRALFLAPLRSRSLEEFWSRRWNLAFVEMSVIAVYRPMRARSSVPVAWISTFLFSGLLHELVISVPVGAGFGLPTLYFLIQLVPLAWERHRVRIGRPLCGFPGTAWTMLWLIGPLPLLFHGPFLHGVAWPLLE